MILLIYIKNPSSNVNCGGMLVDNEYSITLDSTSIQNDEEAKNPLMEQQRDIETSTNAELSIFQNKSLICDSSDNAFKNRDVPPPRNRNRKDKKKTPKKVQEQEKYSEAQNEFIYDNKVKGEEVFQPEKPTVIKSQALSNSHYEHIF